ncbi:peroxide stress protein YaaA [Jannaschia sp. W003]|uniref:peroxide stress protein YaaA n=1 Tax=Jannaschia sp. W003 TaxID=2867012 RepID=UPI0021A49742|nr:peroxide stress protein YaaA [Jannaschia sp. W003]UWQ21639.1 peroxide stress protein YaaA [Jannaschia sp. W003]
MLVVVSPAKRLGATDVAAATAPRFPEETATLVRALRRQGIAGLAALMDLSEPLARLNRDRYRDWDAAPETPAAFTFAGDTYLGLEAATLDADALRWAQERLRILSGLYGVLRPLDAIRPHRLEMGTKLRTRRGRDLYRFWGPRIAETLRADAEAAGARVVLNCASVEYFGAVDREALGLPVVTPVFLEDRPGGPKQIGAFAKRARGAMARFAAETRLEAADDLRAFAAGGYRWQASDSTPERPVFLRTEADQAAA